MGGEINMKVKVQGTKLLPKRMMGRGVHGAVLDSAGLKPEVGKE